MSADAAPAADRRGKRFLLFYALANAGGVAAYVPLLTLLLPTKMAAAAGEMRVEWLGAATFAGAIAASLSSIGFGWLSDFGDRRRFWVAGGLVLTMASYGLIHAAGTPLAIVGAVVFFQAALNMMLGPLAALAADTVPDAQKGFLGGLIGIGQPVGAMVGVLVTLPFMRGPGTQLLAVCAIFVGLGMPLLLMRLPARLEPTAARPAQRTMRRIDLSLLWLARLLVQIAGSVLFAFLLYYFQSLPGRTATEADVARLSGFTLIAAMPLALFLGRASDRVGTRRPFLFGTALAMSAGLAVMALRPEFPLAVAAYAVFGCGLSVFLSLHAVQAMQLLPSPTRRGRDLGLFNLTNTLPALLSPFLAAGLVPVYGFAGVMSVLAVLSALAAGFILAMRKDK